MRMLLILLASQSLCILFYQLTLLLIGLVIGFHFLGFIIVKSSLIGVDLFRLSFKIVTVILNFVS